MNWKLKTSGSILLRVGLAPVFLYAGLDSLFDPQEWIGYVPGWIGSVMPREAFLFAHGIFEIAIGAALFFGVALRPVALAALFDMAAILVLYGVDDATFRDFGLLFMALALYLERPKDGVRS